MQSTIHIEGLYHEATEAEKDIFSKIIDALLDGITFEEITGKFSAPAFGISDATVFVRKWGDVVISDTRGIRYVGRVPKALR